MDYYGTDEQRFHLVPPGISRDRSAPPNAPEIRDDFRREFAIKPNQYVVLMVGSDYKRKGVDRAIKAISAPAALSERENPADGCGQRKGSDLISDWQKDLGISSHVNFVGERGDVPRFLVGADLLLHPAYQENTGTVLIEAMSAGLPVLATDNCGYSFHVDRAGAGKLVPSPFRQETLNNMLVSMLTSENKDQWESQREKIC